MSGPAHSHTRPWRRAPELAVQWEERGSAFWSNVRALLYGPAPPTGWPIAQYFRESWVRSDVPRKALFASLLLHVALFNFPLFIFGSSPPPQKLHLPRIELVYYGPVRDLPPLRPRAQGEKPALPSPPGEPQKPLPRKGADAFHARQTILSAPARVTHPRQTLIQPQAPPEPPKILTPLPNIVQWNARSLPARPRLQFDAAKVRRVTATRRDDDIAAPEIQNQERTLGPMNFASTPIVVEKPKLAVSPSALPRAGTVPAGNDVAPAPNVGFAADDGDPTKRNVIALSATPGPAAPVVDLPVGNLRAAITLSPDGTQPGVPGGSSRGDANTSGGAGGVPGNRGGTASGGGTQPGTGAGGSGGAAGPDGISISGGDPKNMSSVSGNGGAESGALRPASPLTRSPLPERPTPRLTPAEPGVPLKSSRNPALEKYPPATSPELILGPRRVYTLNVNMPNLNSATGSWILQFAEMGAEGAKRGEIPLAPLPGELAGPVPTRKVDPKYPPVLKSARVEGEVILYAIIRRDGSVDSIQLLKGLEPRLDQNAMDALARWQFRPAERNGLPVELEAIVRIPYRVTSPF